MVHTKLSPKENLLRVIQRKDPQYVPVRHLSGLLQGMVKLNYNGGVAEGQKVDRWGVRWAGGIPARSEWEPRISPYPQGHPLADLALIKSYRFPDPQEPGLFDGVFDGVDRANNLVQFELTAGLFERAWMLAGMESLMMGMAEQPEDIAFLLHHIADHQIALIHRIAALGADIVRLADDYGGQQTLLVSPRMWRKLIKPELTRIARAAKEEGLLFALHSCGHIMEIVPDLIEAGVDILDPIQPAANDQARLKELYGDRLTFANGVNSQGALTLGTPADVDAEVRERIRLLAPGGGYIMGPDNNVDLPEANYRAYLEAGERYGRYPLRV